MKLISHDELTSYTKNHKYVVYTPVVNGDIGMTRVEFKLDTCDFPETTGGLIFNHFMDAIDLSKQHPELKNNFCAVYSKKELKDIIGDLTFYYNHMED